MKRAMGWVMAAVLGITTLVACHGEPQAEEVAAPSQPSPAVVPTDPRTDEIASPAASGSGQPHLATAGDGSILMTWVEPGSGEGVHVVRFARLREGSWSTPASVVESKDLFVNWADFPSVREATDGTLFAHWLQKSGEGTYAYDVRISSSTDGGQHWNDPVVIHDDRTQTEHGFVSMVSEGPGLISAIWLDGRNMSADESHGGHGSMTLQYATIDRNGTVASRTMLDDRTCECCQTAMAMTSGGLVAAYRDRSNEEVRDISVVRQVKGGWSSPVVVAKDGWEIAGCPVNGPQLAARGNDVVLAWFTASSGESKTFVAFSSDGGASFGRPVRVDDGAPIGRVDVELLSDGSAAVTWIEQNGNEAEVRAKRVTADGSAIDSIVVGGSSQARSAGFPRTAVSKDDVVFFAWTQPGEPSIIRIAAVAFGGATR